MILFKAIDGYNENTDLMPLDINSKIPLKKHLLEGTIHKTKSGTFTSKPKTRFQSTTKKLRLLHINMLQDQLIILITEDQK